MPLRPAPHQPSHVALVALSLAVAACATAPRVSSSDAATRQVAPPRPAARSAARSAARIGGPRDPITRAEIARINAADAWDVVRTLRGGFLNSRGITSLRRADGGAWPAVFVDGMHVGTIAELRGIPANTIQMVRFLNAGEAMQRYGAGHAAGIIEVTTGR